MIVYPPNKDPVLPNHTIKIFLAGTIDMNDSYNWQSEISKFIEDNFKDITIFNPRRKDWNPSWEQKITNYHFRNQVEWELEKLEESDLILMIFLKDSKSPISLLELGNFIEDEMLIFCDEDFYRKGNVDIFCKKHNKHVYNDWDFFKKQIKRNIDCLITRFIPSNLQKWHYQK
jgi:Nucleoside 2-deoxyribosyltransferase like